ncbi:MAG TPA: PilZ domain-containing protein [Terriglobales bacterium]|nr:PilZ domain-containing protein [Terriglobales bacterium]
MNGIIPQNERRKWPRLPLPIPVFVRSQDDGGKDLLEFASALNVSAGGMLVAVRRSLPVSTQVELEIPSAPILPPDSRTRLARMLGARTLRVVHAEGYHLVALKFSRPLANHVAVKPLRRKVASLV